MRRIKYAWEDAAREAATVKHVDEERRKAFVAGVAWAADRFCRTLSTDPYEDRPGYPHKMMEELTLKDFRAALTDFMRGEMIEE